MANHRSAVLVAIALLVAGCSAGGSQTGGSNAASPSSSVQATDDQRGEESSADPRKQRRKDRAAKEDAGDEEARPGTGKSCPDPDPDAAAGLSARAEVVAPGTDGEPRVEAVVYPRPSYEGRPWTQWGQGLVLDDGTFVSAIGDHCGVNGNSYFYAFDPSSSTLRLVADVLSAVGHQPRSWGYGKVHG